MKYLRLIPWILLAGCGDLPGQPDPAKKFVPPTQVVDFAVLFGKFCTGCHGKTGEFGPAPPLNDPVFLAIVPDEELTRVITQGRKGTSMPAFAKSHGGTLTDQQVLALATGLRESWGKSDLAKKDWPAYLLPVEKGDAKRGLAAFKRACADCHGAEGKGTDIAGAIHDPTFLALASEQVLRRIVITGRPDLGMPDCSLGVGRPLTSPEINDLVALLISWKNR